jgi:hypothetical protein
VVEDEDVEEDVEDEEELSGGKHEEHCEQFPPL